MEAFLPALMKHAWNYALRTGIAWTANYALKQSHKLIKRVDGRRKTDLLRLQQQLDDQMSIVSPAIDLIEIVSARGNTSLEPALGLTRSLRLQIQALAQRISQAVIAEDQETKANSKDREAADLEVREIMIAIEDLLQRLKDAIPLMNLAISTSGANVSGTLPTTVSPSRLLQASSFLSVGDAQYLKPNTKVAQIGPTFTLSLYMLFAAHARPASEEDVRNTTWKEVVHKARVKLLRVGLDDLYDLPKGLSQEEPAETLKKESRCEEYAYQIVIVEDLDDDRVHTFEDDEPQPTSFQDVTKAGIRQVIPVHEVSKLFYADTGKILNIGTEGETNAPILLIKRDIYAHPPGKIMTNMNQKLDISGSHCGTEKDLQGDVHHNKDSFRSAFWKLPRDLDPEWLALEVYTEDAEDSEPTSPAFAATDADDTSNTEVPESLAKLDIQDQAQSGESLSTSGLPPIQTSLSLLEVLLRLLSLQQFQQMDHRAVPDELLNFFLSESATTGATGGDEMERRRIRNEATHHIGFDPYNESPIKRRGEEYQYSTGNIRSSMESDSMRDASESPQPFQHQLGMPSTPQQLLANRPCFSPRSATELPPLPRSASTSKSPRTPSGTAQFKARQSNAVEGSLLANKSDQQ